MEKAADATRQANASIAACQNSTKRRPPQEALKLCERAASDAESVFGPDSLELANAQTVLAFTLDALGRYERALSLHRRALQIRVKHLSANDADIAESTNGVGLALMHGGALEPAREAFEKALSMREKALPAGHPLIAQSLSNLALVLRLSGRFEAAEKRYRRSLQIIIKARGADDPVTAWPIDGLAAVLTALGRYAEAEQLFRQAVAVRERGLGADHPALAQTLSNLGVLLQTVGRPEEALVVHKRALSIVSRVLPPSHTEVIRVMSNKASAEQAARLRDDAEQTWQQALTLLRTPGRPMLAAEAALPGNLGAMLLDRGRVQEAEQLFRESLTIRRKLLPPLHPEVAIGLANLAVALHERGDETVARSMLEEAYSIAVSAGDPRVEWAVAARLMEFHAPVPMRATKARRDLSLAIFYGKRAVEILQKLSGRVGGLQARRSFLDLVQRHYTGLAERLVEAGRLVEAQRVLDLLKEQEYFEYINRDSRGDPRSQALPYAPLEDQWSRTVSAHAVRLTALQQRQMAVTASMPDARAHRELASALESARRSFSEAVGEMTSAFATYDARLAQLAEKRASRQGAVLTEIRPAERAALLHTATLPEGVRLLLTTADGKLTAARSNIKRDELHRLVQQLRDSLRSPAQDPRPPAKRLFDVLIRPIVSTLINADVQILYVSLDGVLRYVPVGALFDGKRYVVELWATAAYTGASRPRGTIGTKQTPENVIAMGVSRGHPGFPPLPGVVGELGAIVIDDVNPKGALPGSKWLDDAFTAASLSKALASRPRVVHVASHFRFSPYSDADTALLLGDGKMLSLRDFRTGDYSLDQVDLLTLSACETGIGANGLEIDGLGRTAQAKGAREVVASLWSVADRSTAKLMSSFYRRAFRSGVAPVLALAQAQRELLRTRDAATDPSRSAEAAGPDRGATGVGREGLRAVDPRLRLGHSHPFYWAPFVVMGAWF
ncbi:MAG: tetratricopeptide repeat protein [Burkholderiaceae bacterium]|nr:tetratricopeptide repeat protein [Burkholderiaceae bacterium]